jgi:hypothetical protein
MAEADVPYMTPNLLDSGPDLTHYFFRTVVEHVHLSVFENLIKTEKSDPGIPSNFIKL